MLSPRQSCTANLTKDIEDFARKGLRTLVFAYKEITDIPSINENVDAEETDWEHVSVKEIESNLILLGATGVEDLLQENVQRCIEDFREANIKVWMLTGDKGLTAKQIGKSCGLISADSASDALERVDSIIAPHMQKSIQKASKLIEIKELYSRRELLKHLEECTDKTK